MENIFGYIHTAMDRLVTNSIKSFEGMTAQRWIRLICIIGGYMLARPWLLKLAADRQKKQFERDNEDLGLGNGPNANDLRGKKAKLGAGKPGEGKILPEMKGEGKVLGEVKERKRKGAGKKMLEQEEAEEEREIRAMLED
jgi:hypothetical protein